MVLRRFTALEELGPFFYRIDGTTAVSTVYEYCVNIVGKDTSNDVYLVLLHATDGRDA